MDINELRSAYSDTVDNIEAGYRSGYLSESQYAEFRQAADHDYATALNTLELEHEPIPVGNAMYSNQFGAVLHALIDQEYDSADNAFADIYEATGMTPDDVLDLIEGSAVPTEELTESLVGVFDATYTDPNLADQFRGLAEIAVEEAILAEQANGQFDTPDGDEYYYSDVDDDYLDDESAYSYAQNGYANFGYGDPRVNELENKIAEFQMAQAVKEDLAAIERRAADGVANGWLPPIAYDVLIGDFNREDDRVAAFSAACGENKVSPDAQLFGMHYALGLFERCGPMLDFSAYSDEEYIPPEEIAMDNFETNQAMLNYEYYRQNR